MIRRYILALAATSVMAYRIRHTTHRSYPMPQDDPFNSALHQWQWGILDKWTLTDQRTAMRTLTSAQFARMKSFRRTLEAIRNLPVAPTTAS